MNRENIFKREVDAPNHAAKAENDQRTINQGAERNLSELGGYAALKHVSDRVKGWIVGISDEVCELKIRAGSRKFRDITYTERRFA